MGFAQWRRRIPASLTAVAALCAAAVFISCYPGDDLTVAEADIVVTTFNKDIDFAGLASYALADSVVHLVPEGGSDDISRAYDAQMLDAIETNMDNLGFNRVQDPALADVLLVTAVTTTEYTNYYSYSPCYYYCWYYPYGGYGWYYPPYMGSYSYTVGTIIVNMSRRVDSSSTDQVPVAWVAALNGYSDKGTNAQRIQNGIDQAFAQSQYLGAGK